MTRLYHGVQHGSRWYDAHSSARRTERVNALVRLPASPADMRLGNMINRDYDPLADVAATMFHANSGKPRRLRTRQRFSSEGDAVTKRMVRMGTLWCTVLLSIAGSPPAAGEPLPAEGYSGSVVFTPSALAAGARPSGEMSDESSCSLDPGGDWQVTRFSLCWEAGLTYTARHVTTQVPVGGARFTLTQSAVLGSTSTSWSEDITLTMVPGSAWGVVSVMSATWTASCTSSCQTTNPSPFTPGSLITAGQSLGGSTSYSNPIPNRVDTFQSNYSLHLVSPGSLIDTPVAWSAPTLRCDNRVGAAAGCVVPSVTPTFTVNRSVYPLAAIGVDWAQNNLPGAPGKPGVGEPLHREANYSKQRANRNRVCRRGWTANPNLPDDSCDEFPFAATREGGSMDGPDCAEIVPQANGTVIVTRHAGPGITCSRAHVPLTQNTNVGGDLGRFSQSQRVLDGDAYWVTTL